MQNKMAIKEFEDMLELPEGLCGWHESVILSSAATFCKALKHNDIIKEVITPKTLHDTLSYYLSIHWLNSKGLDNWLNQTRAWKIWSLCESVDYKEVLGYADKTKT